MKFLQEFVVNEGIAKVWEFFEQPIKVTECIPGVDDVQVIDENQLMVRVTQRVGPIAATFEARVNIVERVHQERIQFTSTGKAVRGAIGNFRATNTVMLHAEDGRTRVVVEGEAALAGVLGSVGQKVIAKQADKITAQFAANLEAKLAPAGSASSVAAAVGTTAANRPPQSSSTVVAASGAGFGGVVARPDGWSRLSAFFSAATFVVALMILFRL